MHMLFFTLFCSSKRYNDNLLRTEVIESLARLIQDRNILHKVDLRQAKKTVIVEIIKNICCISVVPDYYRLKKYNLAELSKKVDEEEANDNCTDNNKTIINENEIKESEIINEEGEIKINENLVKENKVPIEETKSELSYDTDCINENK